MDCTLLIKVTRKNSVMFTLRLAAAAVGLRLMAYGILASGDVPAAAYIADI